MQDYVRMLEFDSINLGIKMHQDNVKNDKILPSNRSFGLVFTFFFTGVFLFKSYSTRVYEALPFLLIAIIFGYAAIFTPNILSRFNKIWASFGDILHSITSPLILAVMFYLIITPLALVMRLFGFDPMLKQYDKNAESYWKSRSSSTSTDLNQQF